MKKFKLLMACIFAALQFVSCNKNDKVIETILPAPKTAVFAKKMVMEENSSKIQFIELTESGRYIVAEETDGKITYKRGKYSAITKATQQYELEGYGIITIEDNTVKVEPDEGEPIVVEFTEAETYPENDFYTTIARAWKVDKTDLSVNMDGTSIGVVKDGCNLPAIATELNSKGLSINADTLKGFIVSEINFTFAKTIEIAFTGQESFVGSFSMDESGVFSYEMQGTLCNKILSGKADGKVDNTQEEGKLYVFFNTEVSSGDKEYSGKVMFILSPAE